jgi:putative Holliday junction resolvase
MEKSSQRLGACRSKPSEFEESVGVIVLALDIGAKRIGVAVSDELGLLASPRGVIRRTSNEQALREIVRQVAESEAELVVAGLPVSLDGQLHDQARSVQAFAERLRRRLPVPLVYMDETLSTVRAEEKLRAVGVRPARIRERIDAAAAAVILDDYLAQQARNTDERKAPDEMIHDLDEPAMEKSEEGWQP